MINGHNRIRARFAKRNDLTELIEEKKRQSGQQDSPPQREHGEEDAGTRVGRDGIDATYSEKSKKQGLVNYKTRQNQRGRAANDDADLWGENS